MTDRERLARALAFFRYATQNDWFRFGDLTGSGMADSRARIFSYLTGEEVKKSAAGITALRKALLAAFGIQRACIAHEDKTFLEAARALLAEDEKNN